MAIGPNVVDDCEGMTEEDYPLSVNADFLKTLGFEPVKIEKVAKLYNKYDFPAMCLGIIEHIKTAATKLDLRKAA